jgi:hypothetical protein
VKRLALSLASYVLLPLLFIAGALVVRGYQLETWTWLNPDEAELMVDGRAALLSPVPFSTWMTSTIGPVWVLVLAAVGALGVPLTIASAHFLAAVIYGLFGFGVLLLLRRAFSLPVAAMLTLAWWVPLALAVPVGTASDFGAMTTSLLPCLFVVAAALIPGRALAAHPWLFAVVGALCGLAILSKYQVLPLAMALVLLQLIVLGRPWRGWIKPGLLAVAGVFVPVVVLALVMALSPAFSFELVAQNFRFLAAYGSVPLVARVVYAVALLLGPYTVASFIAVLVLGLLSTTRTLVARMVMVSGGLASVLIGGNPYGHYLLFLFIAFAIAAAMPVEEGATVLSSRLKRGIGWAVTAVLVIGLVGYNVGMHSVKLASPSTVAAALSPDSQIVNSELAEVCPAQTEAVVWGFAPEVYLDNSLRNAIPIINAVQVINAPANYDSGLVIVRNAILDDDTVCVIDAVGEGFFPSKSLTEVYPTLKKDLARLYTRQTDDLLDCETCVVYVRK